jgi:AraC-like DNA-binding protein
MTQSFELRISLWRSATRRIDKDMDLPIIPHWRLYWNSDPGMTLLSGRERLAILPSQIIIIAPGTRVLRRMTGIVDRHLYVHFSLLGERNQLRDRIWTLTCTAALQVFIQDMLGRFSRDATPSITDAWSSLSLVCSALGQFTAADWPRPVSDQRILDALQTIDLEYAGIIDCRRLAQQAGMSTSGFSRLFLRQIGTSPQRYVMQKRIAVASRMLEEGMLGIDSIAEACGFCDRSYFSVIFAREVGMAPAAYRRHSAVPALSDTTTAK